MTIVDDPPYDPAYDEPAGHGPRRATTDTPAQDLGAEAGVLGAMLDSLRACELVAEVGLTDTDFYASEHRTIYHAICDVLATGATPDPVTVAAALPIDTDVPRHRLLELLANRPVVSNTGVLARNIRTMARLRAVHVAALEVAALARHRNLDGALTALQAATAAIPDNDTTNTWRPVDLAAVIDGAGPPEPALLARQDGQCLLYAGKVHSLNAESESGKSWLAIAACAERIHAGEAVLYLDFEDDAAGLVSRLRALGVPTDAIIDQFVYIRPDDQISAATTAQLEQTITDRRPTLAVIDGVTEAMAQNGWSIIDNDDAAKFLLALPRRVARHGPAVLMIDHVAKDKESRGRHAIGAAHKLAGLDGAAYTLEVTEPFGVGRSGTSRITCTKDRPGHIRGALPDGRTVGEMRVTATSTGDVAIAVAAYTGSTGSNLQVRPTTLMKHLSDALGEMNEAGVEPTSNALLATVRGQRRFLLAGLKNLVDEGYIVTTAAARGARTHRLVRPYRAVDETARNHPADTSDEPPEEF